MPAAVLIHFLISIFVIIPQLVLAAGINYNDTDNKPLTSLANQTFTNCRISGNVGIGTSALQTRLAVEGGNVGIGTWTADGGNLILNGNGNMGIGSAWPGQVLDVNGTSRMRGFNLSQNPSSGLTIVSSSVGIGTWMNGVTIPRLGAPVGSAGQLQYNLTAGILGAVASSGADSNGNVGIGTSGPSAKLAVVGNIGIGTGQSSGYIQTTPPSGSIIMENNLGIGSITPGQVLDVNGSIRSRGTNQQFFGDDLTASLQASAATTGKIRFLTNSSIIVRLDSTGNVGISSATPGQRLDVDGNIRSSGANTLFFGNDNQASISPSASTTEDLLLGTNGSTIVRITNGGNIGVGTSTPVSGLDIVGNVGIGTLVPTGALTVPKSPYVTTTAPSGGMIVAGSVGIGTTIASNGGLLVMNGNVGIGSWVPHAALLVKGHVHTSGPTPTVSSCGGNGQTLTAGNDNAGSIGVGNGNATSCLLTFAVAWTNAPSCFVLDSTTAVTLKAATTTTTLTISGSPNIKNDTLYYLCEGYE